jgi:uncharacterized membrane protein
MEVQMQSKKEKFGWILEMLVILALLLHFIAVLGTWDLIPASIPIHFDFRGKVDAWGGKTDILVLFGLSLLFYFGLTWLESHPRKFNYPWEINENNAEKQYELARNFIKIIKVQSVWLFAIISFQMIGIALGFLGSLGYLFIPLILILSSLTIVGYFILALRTT